MERASNLYDIFMNFKYFTGRWQEARRLVNMVYEAINSMPAFQSDRRLKDQCTGAALSTMGATCPVK